MPKQPSPRDERGALHRRHVAYYQAAATDHAKRSEANAEMRHQAAAASHGTLTDGRDDPQSEGTAMRLSVMAEQASYEARKKRGG